jgi:hypothetical protein
MDIDKQGGKSFKHIPTKRELLRNNRIHYLDNTKKKSGTDEYSRGLA